MHINLKFKIELCRAKRRANMDEATVEREQVKVLGISMRLWFLPLSPSRVICTRPRIYSPPPSPHELALNAKSKLINFGVWQYLYFLFSKLYILILFLNNSAISLLIFFFKSQKKKKSKRERCAKGIIFACAFFSSRINELIRRFILSVLSLTALWIFQNILRQRVDRRAKKKEKKKEIKKYAGAWKPYIGIFAFARDEWHARCAPSTTSKLRKFTIYIWCAYIPREPL